jgi:hypothetical protein
MYKLIRFAFAAIMLLSIEFGATAQTTDTKDIQIARLRLRVGLDNTKFFTTTTHTVNGSSTHNQLATAKAVWDAIVAGGGGGGGGGHIILDDDVVMDQRAGLNFISTPTVSITASDDLANDETEIRLIVPNDGIGGNQIAAGAVGTSEIADGTVALSDMANMATSSLFYRKTAGAGAPEVNSLATLKTDLGLTGTNSGDQTITLTGDVTGSGTGSFAATIADNSVDGTDIQLGSDAQGDVMYYDGTNYVRLPPGTSGQFLQTQGAAANPLWATVAGGGANYQTLRDDNTNMTQRAAGNFVSSSTVSATLTDDAANGETEISLIVPTDGITATQIAADAVGSSEIATDAVAAAEIAAGAVGTSEIADGTVALADLANMATSSLFYRKTAGAGPPEVNSLATLKTDLGLTGTNSGDQTITLTGDVTGSGPGSFAATIADNSVDGTDIQLGSDAQGDVMYYDGTNYVRLPPGTSGQFLQTQGAAANPLWATVAGGGANYQTLRDDNTNMTQRAAGNFVSSSTVAATLTDDAANGETEISLIVPTDAITATQIAADAVGSSEIATDAVGAAEIATDAVAAAEIASGAVGTSEIADGTVALADLANMATSSLFYRKTAGAGAPEVNSLATLKTDLGLTGTNSGDQTITLTGDVTGSGPGSFAATIADNSVDGTDIQLGSDAQGDVMYYDGTNYVRLPPGTSGQFLQTQGAAANPLWATVAGGGGNYQTLRDDNANMTQRAAGNFVSSSTVAATLTDDAANGETEISLIVPTDGITATQIAADAVGSSEIATDAVAAAEIAAGAVGTSEIADGTVALADLANMATSSLFYRKTAGAGAPEVNTLATLKTDLGLTGTNSGDQTITLTGDVTGSGPGSFAATIADNSVDGTDIQLGSDAQGDVMYYDGTNYVRLPPGTSGQYLQTQGAAANPTWATVAGGSPAGSNKEIQYNASGSFGAEANFQYDAATDQMSVGGVPQSGFGIYSATAIRSDGAVVSRGTGTTPEGNLTTPQMRLQNTTVTTGDTYFLSSINNGDFIIRSTNANINLLTIKDAASGSQTQITNGLRIGTFSGTPTQINGTNASGDVGIVNLGSDVVLSGGELPLWNSNDCGGVVALSTTALANVTGLEFAVTSGRIYEFRAVVKYSAANTTTGSAWSINGPAGSVALTVRYGLTNSTSFNHWQNAVNTLLASASSVYTTGNIAIIEGTVEPTANGTYIIRGATEVGGSNITVQGVSNINWREVK